MGKLRKGRVRLRAGGGSRPSFLARARSARVCFLLLRAHSVCGPAGRVPPECRTSRCCCGRKTGSGWPTYYFIPEFKKCQPFVRRFFGPIPADLRSAERVRRCGTALATNIGNARGAGRGVRRAGLRLPRLERGGSVRRAAQESRRSAGGVPRRRPASRMPGRYMVFA